MSEKITFENSIVKKDYYVSKKYEFRELKMIHKSMQHPRFSTSFYRNLQE